MKGNILIIIFVVVHTLSSNSVYCFETNYSYQEENKRVTNSSEDSSKTINYESIDNMEKKMINLIEFSKYPINILIMAFDKMFFQTSDLRPIMMLDTIHTKVEPLVVQYLSQLKYLRVNGSFEEIQICTDIFMERIICILEDLNANLFGYDSMNRSQLYLKQCIYKFKFINTEKFPLILEF